MSSLTAAATQERALAAAFAVRVRELRHARQLSQDRLAISAGISASWVHRVETARPRTITLGLIQRLCVALDVTHNELLGDLPPVTERHSKANRRRTGE